jgi:hypothetical protein
MADDSQDEPLVGFQITAYDDKTEEVTIPVHRHLLKHPRQVEALVKRFIEIMQHGPSVKSVVAVVREDNRPFRPNRLGQRLGSTGRL